MDSGKLSIKERVNGFLHLLCVPNPDSTLNSEAGKLYNTDETAWKRRALKQFRGVN